MNTILRLSSLMLICGCVLLLFGSPAELYAQDPSLEVSGNTGTDQIYDIGTPVKTDFFATLDGTTPAGGVTLDIETSGIDDLKINGVPAIVRGKGTTDMVFGRVQVTGTISVESGAFISARWEDKDQSARADFRAEEVGISPLLIIVESPDSKSPLKVGDTFTQMITIKNIEKRFDSLPLSAWQMDVVYNPEILELKNVTHGNFLRQGGVNTHDVEKEPPMLGKISVSQSRPGLISPPNPVVPDNHASAVPGIPSGVPLAPGDKGTLLSISFKVLAAAEEALGIHNVQLQAITKEDGEMKYQRLSYSILVSDVFVATEAMEYLKEDVNRDGDVNVLDLVWVANKIGSAVVGSDKSATVGAREDVNGDGFINVLDLVMVYTSEHWATEDTAKTLWKRDANEAALTVDDLAAPSVSRNVDPATIRSWIDLARVEDDGSAIFDAGIAKLEALLASKIPSETKLLLNYPNPFNPETWIPYQLAKATEVTLRIHAMNGSLIRTLALGHQAAGVYKSKSQAAYWDGRNELGEQVASGLYFYTLTAGDFSATGKMLVRK